ncbi:hypothetical protein M9H77_21643 [Catharanthus roseus]|uniref:Uncharacterized protein n=1 Tax=Catharanthus roseus TaxID=4058 RepID=A0ACC0AN57_CATRO|nr:hypothetical protein M9H77_21643 [Catharanthus roseus]
MYEVTQNVDLSSKIDVLSKKFDQLLALNTLPTNCLNVQENPRANHHEQVKAVITLRNGKLVDDKVTESIKDDYTSVEKENLIRSENVNYNLACIAPPKTLLGLYVVSKPSRDHTRPLGD